MDFFLTVILGIFIGAIIAVSSIRPAMRGHYDEYRKLAADAEKRAAEGDKRDITDYQRRTGRVRMSDVRFGPPVPLMPQVLKTLARYLPSGNTASALRYPAVTHQHN